jgi:serine/threonine-protein kinase
VQQPIHIPSGRFGRYALLARVGQGGMAEIYRAEVVDEDGELRTVALKLLRPDAPPAAVSGFDFESDVMALLDHPNLVRRIEVGEAGGRRYLAMEDVFGGDLSHLLAAHQAARSAVPLPIALRIVIDLLHGLAAFHAARSERGDPLGLVHGDVNPSNVFLSVRGDVKLGDFGVAFATRGRSRSLPGVTAGKLHYLSPEQALGNRVGQASDVFAVGVILFELVVGYRPFDGADEAQVLARIRAAKVDLPHALVDARLARIVRRALALAPRDRYGTAGELCGDLVRFQLDEGLWCAPPALGEHLTELLGVAG